MAADVKMTLGPGGKGEVEVNGERLRGVVGVRIDHDVSMAYPAVLVWFDATKVDLDVPEADVKITPKTRSLLIAQGWTPPDGA